MRHSLTVPPRQATPSDSLRSQLSPRHPHHRPPVCRVTGCVYLTCFIGYDTSRAPSECIFFPFLHLQRYTRLGVHWKAVPPLHVPPQSSPLCPLLHLAGPNCQRQSLHVPPRWEELEDFIFYCLLWMRIKEPVEVGMRGAARETWCVWREELQGDYIV